mgnify:CR=1 FL=1
MSTATLEAQSTDAAIRSFTVTFLIRRFDPDVDTEPRWQDFDVEMYATESSSNGTTPASKSIGRSSWIQPRARLLMSWITPITRLPSAE